LFLVFNAIPQQSEIQDRQPDFAAADPFCTASTASPFHDGWHAWNSGCYMLILLLLTQRISSIQSDFKKKWLFGLFFLIAVAGCIADGFVLYYFILPLILSIIIRQFRSKSIDEIWLALLAFLAAVIGKHQQVFLMFSDF
jgi:hypothetical protein